MKKQNLPALILKGIVLLPNNDLKIDLDKNAVKEVLDESEYFHNNKILIVNEIKNIEEQININNLPKIGVLAKVTHKIEIPNNKIRFEISGIKRVKIKEYLNIDNNLETIVEDVEEILDEKNQEQVYVDKLKRELNEYIKEIPYASNSILNPIKDIDNLGILTDVIAPYITMDINILNEYLNELDIKKRFIKLLQNINDEINNFQIDLEIEKEIQREIDKSQKEYILREKIKVIKKELGEESLKDEEVQKLYEAVESLKANEEVKNKIKSEIKKL